MCKFFLIFLWPTWILAQIFFLVVFCAFRVFVDLFREFFFFLFVFLFYYSKLSIFFSFLPVPPQPEFNIFLFPFTTVFLLFRRLSSCQCTVIFSFPLAATRFQKIFHFIEFSDKSSNTFVQKKVFNTFNFKYFPI